MIYFSYYHNIIIQRFNMMMLIRFSFFFIFILINTQHINMPINIKSIPSEHNFLLH